MDPELRAYLDRLDSNTSERAAVADARSASILKAFDAQIARIDALTAWKPDLEARFAQLELSVAALHAASSPAATTSSGAPRTPSSFMTPGDLHGQSGHGVSHLPGDFRR